jgi:hypothetical protein
MYDAQSATTAAQHDECHKAYLQLQNILFVWATQSLLEVRDILLVSPGMKRYSVSRAAQDLPIGAALFVIRESCALHVKHT